jgi:hypothetical protein
MGRTFGLLHDFINDFIWDTEVLDVVAADVALGDFPELVAVARGAHDVSQGQVHPGQQTHTRKHAQTHTHTNTVSQ